MATYIFPDVLGNLMKKISVRTQMEAQLLSMTFILGGLIAFAVYLIVYGNINTFSKWMIGINAAAGFVLISSYLVGTFQQYSQYLVFLKAQQDKEKNETFLNKNTLNKTGAKQ